MSLLLLFWVVFTAGLAIMQGLLLPTLRRTPPGMEANTHDFALHKIGVVVYFLPLLLTPTWLAALVALGCRVLLFDACVNYAADDPILYVGKTAKTDKVIQFIALKLKLPASFVSLILRLLVVLSLVVWLFLELRNQP